MNADPKTKLTLLSYSTGGHKFVQFVMAQYDENGRARINENFITSQLEKKGLRKHLQCISIG